MTSLSKKNVNVPKPLKTEIFTKSEINYFKKLNRINMNFVGKTTEKK